MPELPTESSQHYEVSTEKDSWLSNYLSNSSIEQFDAFLEFADYVLNNPADSRNEVVFSANRLTRSFKYSFVPIQSKLDYWFWIDKFKLFFFLEPDKAKRRIMDRVWRSESRKKETETGLSSDAFWLISYYCECESFVERWSDKNYRNLLLERRRKGML